MDTTSFDDTNGKQQQHLSRRCGPQKHHQKYPYNEEEGGGFSCYGRGNARNHGMRMGGGTQLTSSSHHHICCNCGGEGHMYRRCNQPITSFGCIAYRIAYDKQKNTTWPEFLLVQRKDSLAYVELLRGKYVLENVKYIKQLLGNMTRHELDRLLTMTFHDLWSELWMYGASKCYLKEYSDSENKLIRLKEGYDLQDGLGEIQNIALKSLISDIDHCLSETEWGFPKGRRNLMESDKNCALREFREETGIKPNRIRIRHDKPIDEVFTGTNHVRYRHVYYIAEHVSANAGLAEDTMTASESGWQASEIKDVRWYSFADAMSKLAVANVERRELLKRVNSIVLGAHFKHAPCRTMRRL